MCDGRAIRVSFIVRTAAHLHKFWRKAMAVLSISYSWRRNGHCLRNRLLDLKSYLWAIPKGLSKNNLDEFMIE